MQERYTYVNKDNVYIVDSVTMKKDRVHLMKMITLFIHCYCTGFRHAPIYIYIYTLQVMGDLPNRIINWCRISYIVDTTVDGINLKQPPGMYKTV